MFGIYVLLFCYIIQFGIAPSDCSESTTLPENELNEDDCDNIQNISTNAFNEFIIPKLEGKHKGEAGKICVIGGSAEYTGAPYFSAMSALKVGADLVYVITTKSASPVIKSYSPDLIVYPYLHKEFIDQIVSLLNKMDVIVIGPGLGRENETMSLILDVIRTCKVLMKPLVIDADGLYALSLDVTVLRGYPSPGVILTPNYVEADRLKKNIPSINTTWHYFWGKYISVLQKGSTDAFYTSIKSLQWHVVGGGSGRRAGGQGDILAGSLATFYNWAIKSNICSNNSPHQLAQSLAAYEASNLTRLANLKAFYLYGRSLTASDMINHLHVAFAIISTNSE